ncbi:MAG: hypothetical protein HY860_00120 [Chlamydiales bacterium]|nr:hypothetical protein [Chlamydiales bacterium]
MERSRVDSFLFRTEETLMAKKPGKVARQVAVSAESSPADCFKRIAEVFDINVNALVLVRDGYALQWLPRSGSLSFVVSHVLEAPIPDITEQNEVIKALFRGAVTEQGAFRVVIKHGAIDWCSARSSA